MTEEYGGVVSVSLLVGLHDFLVDVNQFSLREVLGNLVGILLKEGNAFLVEVASKNCRVVGVVNEACDSHSVLTSQKAEALL